MSTATTTVKHYTTLVIEEISGNDFLEGIAGPGFTRVEDVDTSGTTCVIECDPATKSIYFDRPGGPLFRVSFEALINAFLIASHAD